jgi:hypothetical protein
MPFDVKIQKQKIEKIKLAFVEGVFADALLAALNTGNGLMQQRIFTESKDVEGNSFGFYVGEKKEVKGFTKSKNSLQNRRNKAILGKNLTKYQVKRAQKGHQTNPKNLEFTGGLRRAIETVIESDKTAAIVFNNDEAAQIAKGQEAQITNIRNGLKGTTEGIGIPIFKLNTEEKEQVIEQGRELINQIMKR